MPRENPTVEPRVELKVRITKSLHDRLVAECGHCGCSYNGFMTLAIAKEIASRRARRGQEAYLESIAKAVELEEAHNAQINP